MPGQIDEIIEKIVDSQTKFAVVKLFKENPYVMDNRLGLALWVGRPENAIAQDLEELIKMGVIHRWGTEPGAIYAYTRDQNLRRELDERWPEINRRANEIKRQQEGGEAAGSKFGQDGGNGEQA